MNATCILTAATSLAFSLVSTPGVQTQRPVSPAIARSAQALAVNARVPIGLELAPFDLGIADQSAKPLAPAFVLTHSPREVLEAIVMTDPRYEWADENGVYRLSPKSSVVPDSFLDTPIDRFILDHADVPETIATVHRLFDPSFQLRRKPEPAQGRGLTDVRRQEIIDVLTTPLSFTLSKVTVRQILNEIIRTRRDCAWRVLYSKSPARYENSSISLLGFDGWAITLGARPRP